MKSVLEALRVERARNRTVKAYACAHYDAREDRFVRLRANPDGGDARIFQNASSPRGAVTSAIWRRNQQETK